MRLFLLLLAVQAQAFMFGNPGQPWLMTEGMIFNNHLCSLRAAFLDDYVYSQSFHGEFKIGTTEERPPITRLASETAQITLNLARRLDLYGIVGSARLQMDQEVFAQNQFAWGVGTKAIFLQWHNLQVGCDFKYFQTDQKPTFLVATGVPYNITSDFTLQYQEYQAALGLSYRSGIFCPYLLGTYINAKIIPHPYTFVINVPSIGEEMDVPMHSFINRNTWGIAVGASLIMGEKGTISLESRFLNQNAINASLEVRF